MQNDYLRSRIKWVSFFRAIIAFISLFLVIFWTIKIPLISDLRIFIKILITVFVLSVIYGVLIKFLRKLLYLAVIQIVIDLIIIGFLIVHTGGIDSPFIFFYVLPMVEGGVFLGKNGVYGVTFSSILLITGIYGAQYFHFFPFDSLTASKYAYQSIEFYYSLSIFSLGFLILGLLIGYLNSETHKIRESLVKSEAQLYDLQSLKNTIIESLNSGLVVINNTQDEITYINTISHDIVTKICEDAGLEGLKKLFEHEINNAANIHEYIRVERKTEGHDGQAYWLDCTIMPLFDHNAKLIGTLLNIRDITSYKDMEEKIRITDKFAFLGQLSAVLAHEIRNPLASLRGSIDFLKEHSRVDEEESKIFNILQREIERLNKIINDFLYYSRAVTLEKTKIYIKNLVDEVWFELTFSKVQKEKNTLIYSGDEHAIIEGDPNQIRQVFLNLFINALTAINENNASGNIYVNVKNNNQNIVVEIEDEGGGVDSMHTDKIFEPFYSTKTNGTGLGLAIVYKIIKDHGGDITVRNSAKGAVFTITLKS